MLILALALAAPTALTDTHQRDIACLVEIAILADAQRRGVPGGTDVQSRGKRWGGLVGTRIVQETGQPRELVGFAMNEAAKARRTRAPDDVLVAKCVRQMKNELATADALNAPLPKPVKAPVKAN